MLGAGEEALGSGVGEASSSFNISISSSFSSAMTSDRSDKVLPRPGVGKVSIRTSFPLFRTATVRPRVRADDPPVDRAEASAGEIQPDDAPSPARLADQIEPRADADEVEWRCLAKEGAKVKPRAAAVDDHRLPCAGAVMGPWRVVGETPVMGPTNRWDAGERERGRGGTLRFLSPASTTGGADRGTVDDST